MLVLKNDRQSRRSSALIAFVGNEGNQRQPQAAALFEPIIFIVVGGATYFPIDPGQVSGKTLQEHDDFHNGDKVCSRT